MDKQTLSNELKAHADYLRRMRLPVGETEAIEHTLRCALSLEKLAKELAENETDHKPE